MTRFVEALIRVILRNHAAYQAGGLLVWLGIIALTILSLHNPEGPGFVYPEPEELIIKPPATMLA